MEKISWKQKIKKLQIIFFICALFTYFSYSHFKSIYNEYTNTKQQLEELKVNKVTKKENELAKLQEKNKLFIQLLKKDNFKAFIKSYNNCYPKYIDKIYGVTSKGIDSLTDCINNKMIENLGTKYNNNFIKNFKDIEIEKIAISLGINKNKLEKFDIDQKTFLKSLDQEIFNGNENTNLKLTLEENVSVLNLGKPILINKNYNLYKTSFTFSIAVNYNQFMDLFKNFQNRLGERTRLYYTISNVSEFDITKPNESQKVNIQGNFYFTK